jgi:CTP:molybdopterin cytidylyltransferase MocA
MDHPTDILVIEADQDAVLMDMDTPEEYRKYRKLRGIADALC